jgi:hypothetical protein
MYFHRALDAAHLHALFKLFEVSLGDGCKRLAAWPLQGRGTGLSFHLQSFERAGILRVPLLSRLLRRAETLAFDRAESDHACVCRRLLEQAEHRHLRLLVVALEALNKVEVFDFLAERLNATDHILLPVIRTIPLDLGALTENR